MDQPREVRLGSGAILRISPAPFAEAKALFQAVSAEMRGVPFSRASELMNVLKDVFCAAFSSREIERCLWPCLIRCTYNAGEGNEGIKDGTFESATARGDYTKVCMEVAKDNIAPFVKDLSAVFAEVSEAIENYRK